MKIQLKIDASFEEVEVTIQAPTYSEEVTQLMERLQTKPRRVIEGYKDEQLFFIKLEDIYCVYAEDNRLYIQTDDAEYSVKYKMYELEKQYDSFFFRIHKSMLIQFDAISSIQVKSFGETIVILENGMEFPISRKYLKELKDTLIGRRKSRMKWIQWVLIGLLFGLSSSYIIMSVNVFLHGGSKDGRELLEQVILGAGLGICIGLISQILTTSLPLKISYSIHYVCINILVFLFGTVGDWFEPTWKSILGLLVTIAITYVIINIMLTILMKKQVDEINHLLKERDSYD